MLTLTYIDKLLQDKLDNPEFKKNSKDYKTSYLKEIDFLRMIKRYLLTNPSEEYILREKERLETLIGKIVDRFAKWNPDPTLTFKDLKHKEKYYFDLNEMPKHKRHLQTVEFILSN